VSFLRFILFLSYAKEVNMANTKIGMIQEFEGQVESFAGHSVAEQVMAGSVDISAKTSGEQVSLWVKGAVERLDALVGEEAGARIMESCGKNCSERNHKVIERARARRLKAPSEEAFLAAEEKKSNASSELAREGNFLYQTYTPTRMARPMRCYCAFVNGLPPDQEISRTYCNCSKAFVRAFWQEVLDRPVSVEVLETALTGSKQCRFKITLE
jgi:predicted hydrocarbon binding protein